MLEDFLAGGVITSQEFDHLNGFIRDVRYWGVKPGYRRDRRVLFEPTHHAYTRYMVMVQ